MHYYKNVVFDEDQLKLESAVLLHMGVTDEN